MLTVHVDKQFRNFLNLTGGYGLAIDAQYAFSRLHAAADQYHIFLQGDLQFPEFFPQRLILRRAGKHQFHQSALCPLAQHILVKSGSQRQINRTDKDGFARAGLSGEDIQSLPEFHFCLLNQSQILHM